MTNNGQQNRQKPAQKNYSETARRPHQKSPKHPKKSEKTDSFTPFFKITEKHPKVHQNTERIRKNHPPHTDNHPKPLQNQRPMATVSMTKWNALCGRMGAHNKVKKRWTKFECDGVSLAVPGDNSYNERSQRSGNRLFEIGPGGFSRRGSTGMDSKSSD